MNAIEKEQWYFETFKPKLLKSLERRGLDDLYYEVFIDVDECFERWFDFMYKYSNLAIGAISRWMIRRDKWYWSPEYVSALDKAYEQLDDDNKGACFGIVLANSLK